MVTKPLGLMVTHWTSGSLAGDIVKGEALSVFQDFFKTDKFGKCLNSTFTMLVPKKEGAVEFKDFRPISLVGSLHKLIS